MSGFDTTEINRRMSNAIQLGLIEVADYSKCRARVRIGELLTGWLPMMALRAGPDRSWWPFEEGEQVCVFAPGGNLSSGVIMGAVFTEANAPNGASADLYRQDFGNGSWIEHDRTSGKLTLNAMGDIDIIAGGNVRINGTRIDLN